ncbi:MAG: imidazolonepropionase [Planctomycetes bacterium]|nr:imidazolonepropionase [Planctomycetota bacterium]
MGAPPVSIDLLVAGASELATAEGIRSRGGAELGKITVLQNGALAIHGERILAVGPERELRAAYAPARLLDARGGTIVPGFVDAHTHPVFAGTREEEFELRTRGQTYLEIAQSGGGILSSVRGVRAAGHEELLGLVLLRLARFLELGTTTLEAKSGYGLSLADELKSLEVLAEAGRRQPVEIVPTFLGAHEVPPEFRGRKADYVELLVDEMLPKVAERRLAEYCDAFTEAHTFDLADTRRVFERARELGLGLRLHADQLSAQGGAELAAELGAASADHLEFVGAGGIAALARAGVVPVLCPLVPLYLRQEREAPARRLIEAGLAPALSTDFNPGSCYLQSLPEVLSWAALRYRMSAAECLTAATLNAACSLGRGHEIGTLEPGKRADVVVLDQPNHKHLVYELGRNPVRAVIVRGRVEVERGSTPSALGSQSALSSP